jgi:hypothetical protein
VDKGMQLPFLSAASILAIARVPARCKPQAENHKNTINNNESRNTREAED